MNRPLNEYLQNLLDKTEKVIKDGMVTTPSLPARNGHGERNLLHLQPTDFLEELREIASKQFTAAQAEQYAQACALKAEDKTIPHDLKTIYDRVTNSCEANRLIEVWREHCTTILIASVGIEGHEEALGTVARGELVSKHG